MADANKLARFSVAGARDTFNMHIEDEAGNRLELIATREQLDLIADELDDVLLADDSADEVDEDDTRAA